MTMQRYIYTFRETQTLARYRARQIITQQIIAPVMNSPVPPVTPPLLVSIATTRVTTASSMSALTEAQLIVNAQNSSTERNTEANARPPFPGTGQTLSSAGNIRSSAGTDQSQAETNTSQPQPSDRSTHTHRRRRIRPGRGYVRFRDTPSATQTESDSSHDHSDSQVPHKFQDAINCQIKIINDKLLELCQGVCESRAAMESKNHQFTVKDIVDIVGKLDATDHQIIAFTYTLQQVLNCPPDHSSLTAASNVRAAVKSVKEVADELAAAILAQTSARPPPSLFSYEKRYTDIRTYDGPSPTQSTGYIPSRTNSAMSTDNGSNHQFQPYSFAFNSLSQSAFGNPPEMEVVFPAVVGVKVRLEMGAAFQAAMEVFHLQEVLVASQVEEATMALQVAAEAFHLQEDPVASQEEEEEEIMQEMGRGTLVTLVVEAIPQEGDHQTPQEGGVGMMDLIILFILTFGLIAVRVVPLSLVKVFPTGFQVLRVVTVISPNFHQSH